MSSTRRFINIKKNASELLKTLTFLPLLLFFIPLNSYSETSFDASEWVKENIPQSRIDQYKLLRSAPDTSTPLVSPMLMLKPAADPNEMPIWQIKSNLKQNKSVLNKFEFFKRNPDVFNVDGTYPFKFIYDLGSSPWQKSSLLLEANFDLPAPRVIETPAEDDGSTTLATPVTIGEGEAVKVSAYIGDGPWGSKGTGSGDFDVYSIKNLKQGQLLRLDVDTPEPYASLIAALMIRSPEGRVFGQNFFGTGSPSLDPYMEFVVPEEGDYNIFVSGFGNFILIDHLDSSTGLGNVTGAPLEEGEYSITMSLNYKPDEQDFLFFLKPGDVFGVGIEGTVDSGTRLSFRDSSGAELMGSNGDAHFLLPDSSPLPDGVMTVNHVVDKHDFYSLNVTSTKSGKFTLDMVAKKPFLNEGARGDVQTLFIDFDGARVDLSDSIFAGAPKDTFIAELSPLSAYLEKWGLAAADEDVLIRKIMQVIQRSIVKEIRQNGKNRKFGIRLLNSRDHKDPFGQKNVSRVIVGGSVEELGVQTIGIAQSIDVGNYDTEETAFVLLDILSSSDPAQTASLNNIAKSPNKPFIDLVAEGVGIIAAHEAGHFLGNFHTEHRNDVVNVMDQGGRLAENVLGVGADLIFGTADDEASRFGIDEFSALEPSTGLENTASRIGFGATRP